MHTSEVKGFYGHNIRTTILVAENNNGAKWYCVEGSKNINITYDPIEKGVVVETLKDVNGFHADNPINTTDELIDAINS